MLTAVAGTAIEASRRHAGTAIVIVDEFRTGHADAEKVALNTEDFRRFVGLLLHLHANDIVDGRLYGPAILAPGVDIVERVDLFIGKAVSDWLPTGQVP